MSGRRLGEYLHRIDTGVQRHLGAALVNDGSRPWKLDAVTVEVPLSAAGALRDSADDPLVRQDVCPTCATLLDADVALAGDELVHDDVIGWPT